MLAMLANNAWFTNMLANKPDPLQIRQTINLLIYLHFSFWSIWCTWGLRCFNSVNLENEACYWLSDWKKQTWLGLRERGVKSSKSNQICYLFCYLTILILSWYSTASFCAYANNILHKKGCKIPHIPIALWPIMSWKEN